MRIMALIQLSKSILSCFCWLQFVLSGFAQHLASHFGKTFSNHSYRYDCSNDSPNCFASYSANPGSLVKCPG